MKQLADNLYQIPLMPRNGINAYFSEGVVFDAGSRLEARRLLRALEGQDVTEHALTHGHPDHQGASHSICERFDVPLACGEGDADAVTSGELQKLMPDGTLSRIMMKLGGPAHPATHRLRGGDTVGSFTAIETPGHSPGDVVYWRESDRTLILGDVLLNMSLLTTVPGLHEPPRAFTPNVAQNRDSARKLLGLRPAIVCFGHGPPLRDPDRFEAFIQALPN